MATNYQINRLKQYLRSGKTIECSFELYYKEETDNLKFSVEAYLLDEDEHDTYSIRVYDNSKQNCRFVKSDENEIAHAYLDSTGGGCADESLTIYPMGSLEPLEEVEEIITDVLFGNSAKNIEGIIIPF